MTSPSLNLLVLKSHQIDNAVAFYRVLGMAFVEEKHGKGPLHFAARLGDLIFEIYPAPADQATDKSARLGFIVANLSDVLGELRSLGVAIESEPKQTPWGLRAVVRDPDGRAVELTQAEFCS